MVVVVQTMLHDMCVSPYTPMIMQLIRVAGRLGVRLPATPPLLPALMAVVNLYPSNDRQPPLSHAKTGMRTTSKNCTCEHHRCVNVETVLLVHTQRDAEKIGPAAMQRKHSVKCGNRHMLQDSARCNVTSKNRPYHR